MELTVETSLEPDLPICDPHHHLWKREGSYYGVEEFLSDISGGHNIIQTVFLECKSMYRESGPEEIKPVGETEFVVTEISSTHGQTNIAAGIIGYVDLTLGKAVKPVVEAHIATAKNRFRGVRNMAVWDASPDINSVTNNPKLYMEPRFREGFACLQEYGLSFDAWVFHTQLMQVVDLARTFPDITIILDHIGTPLGIAHYSEKRSEVFKDWQQSIATLASCPNVMVKLGGLGMPLCGFDWNKRSAPTDSIELAAAISPYFMWCIEKFGVDRCMFESNFPMDKQSYSYTVLWNAFKRITKELTEWERAALFYNTAIKAYRLLP